MYSVVVLLLVYQASNLSRRQIQVLHTIDILCASLVTFVSEGPVSPFFLFFLFAVVAAAFRWAFWKTLMTAAVVVMVFFVETAFAAVGPWQDLFPDGELNRILLRAAYLLLTGFLLSYLAEQDKRSRAELATIADFARQPRIASSLGESVRSLSAHLLRVFRADLIAVVLQGLETDRTMLWLVRADPSKNDAGDEPIELDAVQHASWLFSDVGSAWHAAISRDREDVVRVSVPGNWPLERREMSIPAPLRSIQNPASILAINFGLPAEWKGRIYVFGPTQMLGVDRAVHLLESMIEHVTPPITNVFLMRRLRQRAGADERARVARELHDGAIQSLFGLDMKVEALRRANNRTDEMVDSTLVEVQSAVRREVHELRDLMHALRPVEIEDAQQLHDVVRSVVERFRRDTGITARFETSSRAVSLPSAMSIELVRVIQEALVNVRKHSGAENVLVRIDSADDHTCRVTIADDGRGFEFDGRVDAADMDRRRIGPAIIRERARIAKARLVVESAKGKGARLELTFGKS